MRVCKESFFAILILMLATLPALADFKVPALTGPVVDEAGIIRASDRSAIEALARKFQEAGAAQIQILTVQSLDGMALEQASLKVVETWKLGTATKDNGVLIFVAFQDRKLRIEVGQGLEGNIPDVTAGRIVRDLMVPYFRQDQASKGILAAAYALGQRINPELMESMGVAGPRLSQRKAVPPIKIIFFIFIFLIFILSRLGRRSRFLGGSAGLGGFGGGFGGGGFGGGGWGGGGGGFSGGGSSGSW